MRINVYIVYIKYVKFILLWFCVVKHISTPALGCILDYYTYIIEEKRDSKSNRRGNRKKQIEELNMLRSGHDIKAGRRSSIHDKDNNTNTTL